jgi:hypothetical protein
MNHNKEMNAIFLLAFIQVSYLGWILNHLYELVTFRHNIALFEYYWLNFLVWTRFNIVYVQLVNILPES